MNNTGTVTFGTAGTVIITATKAEEGDHEEVSDSYTLYITMKPADKNALVNEIKRAMTAHGDTVDLNYIDTAAITDMRYLFSSHKTRGYGLGAFNGKISMWDVREVTTMKQMFSGTTAFNGNLSEWRVGKATNMSNMFQSATVFNGDISKWDVSAVTTMNAMFLGATAFDRNLSRWNVRSVTSMQAMFANATKFTGTGLNCWADRIHANVKAINWLEAGFMFTRSGVSPLPTWYKTTNTTPPASCKPINTKDSDRE